MAVAHLPLMLQERLPALIAAIYESALEPARWQGFLALFGAALRSPASVIWANDFAQRTVAAGRVRSGDPRRSRWSVHRWFPAAPAESPDACLRCSHCQSGSCSHLQITF